MRPFQLVEEQIVSQRTRDCFESLDKAAPIEYRELASLLARRWIGTELTTIGIGGGQGCGKSTLCGLVEEACAFFGEKVAVLSLDDFYLTRKQRLSLSNEVHGLLATRGPPGTHDIHQLICAVRSLQNGNSIRVPIFDKGLDDRTGSRLIEPGVIRVIVEGWCIGARPEPLARLSKPINTLESDLDPNGDWRTWVNDQLDGPYGELRSVLKELVFIQVPSIECVRKWRLQQESERPSHLRMDEARVRSFVEHYERLTFWMLEDLGKRADIVVELDVSHDVAKLRGL
ncbi:MAG: kinase [Gammaproteobacteria bacterium]|nr:kinase [Gammaproteobacteria bacterium]